MAVRRCGYEESIPVLRGGMNSLGPLISLGKVSHWEKRDKGMPKHRVMISLEMVKY